MASTQKADTRFAALSNDPRYRLPSSKHGRLPVDKRFSRMLRKDDTDFIRRSRVDKYGRRLDKEGPGRDVRLDRLYRSDNKVGKEAEDPKREQDDESGSSSDDVEASKGRRKLASPSETSSSEDELSIESQDQPQRTVLRRDAARDGFSDSSSDEPSSSDEEDEEENQDEGDDEESDKAPEIPLGEVSSRIAIVNLDWDNIRAQDIMAVANSFVGSDGRIETVAIYPSEYGKERLEREELEGPPKEIFSAPTTRGRSSHDQKAEEELSYDKGDSAEEDDDAIKNRLQTQNASKGEEFNPAQLRRYQLDRLRYFYAVITCSSPSIAQAIYSNLDGREYLSSANFFDLRFIPDDISFEGDRPRETCTTLLSGYKPNEFVTEALTHSKVKLTWDAEDSARKEVQKRAFSRAELEEEDLKAYIGGGSSSDSESEPDHAVGNAQLSTTSSKNNGKLDKKAAERQRMRALLGLTDDKAYKPSKSDGPVGDMQITFTSGLSSNATTGGRGRDGVFENSPPRDETTRERYVRKERERKAKRREKAKAKRDVEDGDHEQDESGSDPDDKATHDKEKSTKGASSEAAGADPFDDPFFNDDDDNVGGKSSKTQKDKMRKQDRIAKRDAKQAELAKREAERARLEVLMDDEGRATGDKMKHFDMKEIVKESKRKDKDEKRKKKGKKSEKVESGAMDNSLVDGKEEPVETADPRFARLFESHEFAIDPSNPRFVKTEGMQKLLEEGRKRRREEGGEREEGTKKSRKDTTGTSIHGDADGEDTQKLLARVKARAGTSKGK